MPVQVKQELTLGSDSGLYAPLLTRRSTGFTPADTVATSTCGKRKKNMHGDWRRRRLGYAHPHPTHRSRVPGPGRAWAPAR